MRPYLLFLFPLLALMTLVAPHDARADISTGLVGHWTFDNTTNDASSQGNHGTASGGPTYTTGKINQGLTFDGVDDYVSISNSIVATLDTAPEFTISAWVKPSNATSRLALMGHGNHFNTDGEGFAIQYRGELTGDPVDFAINNNLGSGATDRINNVGDLSTNWHLLTSVIDRDGNFSVYLDGSLVGSDPASKPGGTINSGESLNIGNNGVGNGLPWSGLLDDVRIYNRALSSTDIQELYNYTGADTQAPSTPTNLSATAVSSSQINLAWTASTDNVGVTNYRIYRCAGTSCTPTLRNTIGNTPTYSDTGLTAGLTFYYQVGAVDAAGNESTLSTIASATTQSSGGLVAHYTFDNTLNDVATADGAQNGTLVGGPTYTTAGKINQALTFDGVDDYVTVSPHSSLEMGTGDMTLAAWINMATIQPSSSQGIVTKGAGGITNTGYALFSPDSGNSVRIQISNGVSRFGVDSNTGLGLNDAQWHHVAVVVDRDANTTFYKDGLTVRPFRNAVRRIAPNMAKKAQLPHPERTKIVRLITNLLPSHMWSGKQSGTDFEPYFISYKNTMGYKILQTPKKMGEP